MSASKDYCMLYITSIFFFLILKTENIKCIQTDTRLLIGKPILILFCFIFFKKLGVHFNETVR